MNYASKILQHLAQAPAFTELLLAPGAPPVERRADSSLQVAFPQILGPQDIRETLGAFSSHARALTDTAAMPHGTFSFGMHGLGRFRVSFVTQRGSNVLSIQKIPATPPDLATVVPDTATARALDAILDAPGGRILVLAGPNRPQIVLLAYALIQRVNQKASRLIFTVEPAISFLVGHSKSLVVQTEVNTDIPSLADGLLDAARMQAGLVFTRDLRTPEEFAAVIELAESRALVIVGHTALSRVDAASTIRSRLPPQSTPLFDRLAAGTVWIEDGAGSASLSLSFEPGIGTAPPSGAAPVPPPP